MLFSSRLTSLALTIAVIIGAPQAMAAGAAPAPAPAAAAPANAANIKAPLPLDDLRTFAEVMDRIMAAYVDPVDDKRHAIVRSRLTPLAREDMVLAGASVRVQGGEDEDRDVRVVVRRRDHGFGWFRGQ